MGLIKIDSSNDENFKGKTFELMPRGIYLFEIAKPVKVRAAKSSNNTVVDVELKCIDDAEDGKYKGRTIFDTIALTKKAEFKLVHLVLAAGTQTKEDIKERGVDPDLLLGQIVKVDVTVEGPSVDKRTGAQYPEKNRVQRYVFDDTK